ncbi:hypothetical protein INT45_007673 [Circinella minor]|uniref:C2H2-type domain-containing protein n=1 Tax=Circinella minor TaxID=1195481 RepID=A0A8H7RWB4_9FUNG|nr:hypothetical protein INT45_007673 [Circinella minor]
MSAAISTPSFQRQPPMPTRNISAAFTCITCRIAFPTSERQRNHCRTDWHKYNLKRKIADLVPLNAEQFAQKVLAQQAQNREAEERQGLIYECAVCRKSYYSENGYHNHMQSKKHREMEIKSEILGTCNYPSNNNNNNNYGQQQQQQQQQLAPLFSDQSDLSDLSDLEEDHKMAKKSYLLHNNNDPLRLCLFCSFPSNDFDENVLHMVKYHGFFLPDEEYLQDRKGLITYLADKIDHEHLCLYCNGRGKEWKTAQAARAHMLDKGHCKMAYDDSEDPEDLLTYYNFEPLQEITPATTTSDETELVLENGLRMGHRQNVRFFRQRLRKNREEDDETVSATKRLEEAEAYAREQGLTRKERRHLLAVTDGRKGAAQHDKINSFEGIKEAAVRRDFRYDLGVKNNLNTTLRIRNQVPI